MLSIIILVAINIGSVRSTTCCPEEQWIMYHGLCSDNVTSLNVTCDDRGSFMLNPEEDPTEEFWVKDENLYYESVEIVTPTGFCISRYQSQPDSPVSSTEVAIVCFPYSYDPLEQRSIYSVFMIISILFLVLTILVYLLIPELRDLQGKVLMVYVGSLCASYISLTFIYFASNLSVHWCIINARILYFCLLSTFSWMNVVSYNVWKTITVKRSHLREFNLTLFYIGWGIGIPTLATLTIIIIDNIPGEHPKTKFGDEKCWFSGYEESWIFFHGPTTVMILINIVLFVITAIKLRKDESLARLRCMKNRWLLYLKLFIMMGVTWIFEIISYGSHKITPEWVWYVTDSLNTLQGVVIFLILVPFRQRVRRGLVEHEVFGIKWPRQWAAQQDDESETMIVDELQLSKTSNNI